jgi:hypothetical protein
VVDGTNRTVRVSDDVLSGGAFEIACGTQICRVPNSQDDQTRAVLPRRGDNPPRRLAEFRHDYRNP